MPPDDAPVRIAKPRIAPDREREQRLIDLPDLGVADLQRPIAGSLPLGIRPGSISRGAPELRPAILFAPPHLRSKTGSGASPAQGAKGLGTATGSPWPKEKAKKKKKPKKPKEEHGNANGDEDAVATPFPVVDPEWFLEFAEAMLEAQSQNGSGAPTGMAPTAASYDFDEYVLLRSPDDPYATAPGDTIAADPRFDRFCKGAYTGIKMFTAQPAFVWPPSPPKKKPSPAVTAMMLYHWWRIVCSVRAFNRFSTYSQQPLPTAHGPQTLEYWYGWSLARFLDDRYYIQRDAYYDSADPTKLGPLLTVACWEEVIDGVFDQFFGKIKRVVPTAPKDDYAFEPYSTNEILFGLRVVHRQDWRRLGYARGELVRSIPLGPRETQRVSVEIVTRRKTVRTSEQSTSFETTSESTNTSRDTTEVVDEATTKLGRKADASLGGGYPGVFNAELSAGTSEDLGSSSKQTKTALNELMEKTASRMRRDTKVTVSVESESTFKDTRSSEITNPNDELGITYLYYRLQLRYWVTTEIADLESVVFVPQQLPSWQAVDEGWVRDHADAIARTLLDRSFAAVLTAIRQEPKTLEYEPTPIFNQAATEAINAIPDYKSFSGGGDMPDLLASGQEFYARDYEKRAT
jgi:hypothetical protein